MFPYGLLHMDMQVLANKQELICYSSVQTQDVILKTCLKRWKIETNGKRESGNPCKQHNMMIYIYMYVCVCVCVCVYNLPVKGILPPSKICIFHHKSVIFNETSLTLQLFYLLTTSLPASHQIQINLKKHKKLLNLWFGHYHLVIWNLNKKAILIIFKM